MVVATAAGGKAIDAGTNAAGLAGLAGLAGRQRYAAHPCKQAHRGAFSASQAH
jgi:hypothetical protein